MDDLPRHPPTNTNDGDILITTKINYTTQGIPPHQQKRGKSIVKGEIILNKALKISLSEKRT